MAGTPANPVTRTTVRIVRKKVPLGPPPAIAYFAGPEWPTHPHPLTGYLHPADEARPPIPVSMSALESVSAFTPFRRGYLVLLTTADGKEEVRYYKARTEAMVQMAPLQPAWSEGLARGADGSVAVSLSPGSVTEFDASGKAVQHFSLPVQKLEPERLLSDQTVLARAETPHRTKFYRLTPDNSAVKWLPPQNHALDVSAFTGDMSMFARTTRVGKDLSAYSSCADTSNAVTRSAAVLDGSTFGLLWVDCGYFAGSFSPDGRVMASLADTTRLPKPPGTGMVGLLDEQTGDVLVRFEGGNERTGNAQSIRALTWEDSTHVLAFSDASKSTVYRLGVDGSVERAAVKVPFFGYVVLEQQPSAR